MNSFTTQTIADRVNGELVGPGDIEIHSLEELGIAQNGQLTFVGDRRYAGRWPESNASAALVTRGLELEAGDDRALIFVENADLALAIVLELFAPPVVLPPEGIHPTAVIDESATLGANVRIGPHCYIGPSVRIGDNTALHANVSVLDQSAIGSDCVMYPGVVVRERCTIGDRCIFHQNVNIGADGFGYRPASDGRGVVKIPQIGTVEIGNDVELGAGTCVDRGKFSATVIGDGCKLDNLVQIGHNCKLGRCVIMSGHTAIAGSVTIGDGCMFGGMTAIKDHLTIGAGVRLGGCSQVMHDIPAGETWVGSPAQPYRETMQQVQAVRKLPALMRQFKRQLG